jgi:ABC-type sugar transport systems, ATPase components
MSIRLEHFTKRFGGFVAVADMNLAVEEGEMLALLGPSGCGKTTTLFAISGILKVDGGRIRIGERDVTDLPAQKRNVGVVFQSYALYPHMTAYENIAFPLKLRGIDKPRSTNRSRNLPDFWRSRPCSTGAPPTCRAASSSVWRWPGL